jgi:hypothetical protein
MVALPLFDLPLLDQPQVIGGQRPFEGAHGVEAALTAQADRLAGDNIDKGHANIVIGLVDEGIDLADHQIVVDLAGR